MASNSDSYASPIKGNICFFCERLFISEPALHKHLKTHVCDNSKPVCFCVECNPKEAVARVEEIYKQYLHVDPKNIDKTSVAYLNRLHHCKLKSFENPIYRCQKCGCVFNGLAVFVKHMQVHAKKPPEVKDIPVVRNSLFYCPTCRLPYRATVPYIKHLKKHLIAVIRYNGIKEKGSQYNFDEETYDNTGSLQCPVTDCRRKSNKESDFISHMEEHLGDMNSEEILSNRVELVPVKGRPSHSSLSGVGTKTTLGDPSSADYYSDSRVGTKPSTASSDRASISRVDVDDGCEDLSPPSPAPKDVDTARVLTTDEEDEIDENHSESMLDVLFCRDCDLSFDKLSTGFRHKVDVHGQDLRSCSICWRRLSDSQELIDHVVRAHDDSIGKKRKRTLDESFSFGETPPVKDVCLASTPKSGESLCDTVPLPVKYGSSSPASASKTILDLNCRTCKAKHPNYSELLKHQHYVHGITDKRCRLCNKFINSYPSLIGHVNACTGKGHF